jgi:hypothetical protein
VGIAGLADDSPPACVRGLGSAELNYFWLFIGAVIVTYWVSRLIIRLTGTRRRTWGLAGVHALTFLGLALITGLIRGGINTFDLWSPILFGVAAVLWFRYDVVRRNTA